MAKRKQRQKGAARQSSGVKTRKQSQVCYSKIKSIDGSHPLWEIFDDLSVAYRARKRHGAQVAFFNFPLAKEMGLIPKNHPEELNQELEEALIDTFSIRIINEYDLIKEKKFKKEDLKEGHYHATRYLQLQHKSRIGKSSGDGRSIWNGSFKGDGVEWDISSCGTGGTKLSPAVAQSGEFFESGDPTVSYGCGTADLSDGIVAVLMSEIFHHYGYPTERTLCVLQYRGGQSINVRAQKNLLRPAHFFRYLKSGNLEQLKKLVNYFIDRQLSNGSWKKSPKQKALDLFLDEMTRAFARSTALFESFYIFCWLDWDGDNILAEDAAILDYGSVRQFGLFHKEYRFDDDDRWSTTIGEQKSKGRYTVQSFAQLVDFVKTGKKRSIKEFRHDPALKAFEEHFQYYKKFFLLKRVGFSANDAERILCDSHESVERFLKSFEKLERRQSKKGVYRVDDGLCSNAIYCMKDFLREFPQDFLRAATLYSPEQFNEVCGSSYAEDVDLRLNSRRVSEIKELQEDYLELMGEASRKLSKDESKLWLEITMRSSVVNRFDRITGNGLMGVTEEILKKAKKKKGHALHKLVKDFLDFHISHPQSGAEKKGSERGLLKVLEKILKENREEI